jgi:hypothetical protein
MSTQEQLRPAMSVVDRSQPELPPPANVIRLISARD